MHILVNARIYTFDKRCPTASALLVERDRILAVGDEGALRAASAPRRGAPLDVFDAGGRAVIPGLTDAHMHLEHYALGLQWVDCETPTRAGCLQRVAERARQVQPGEWILGHGWNQNQWEDGFGSAAELDAAAPANPVYLTAKSLHAAWANSAALRLANVTAATPDPAGGRFGRLADGTPDGTLFETAMDVVTSVVPAPTVEQVAQAVVQAQPVLWRLGLTGLHDFDRRRCFAALQTLRQRGELHLRVVKSIPLDDLPHAVALGLRSGFGDDWLRIGSVKAFADGALGPQTAAMLQPYNGTADNRGILMLDAEELFEHGRPAVENGLSLAVHAIGDRANHEVLNAYAQLRQVEARRGGPRLRHRIEHVQLLHPDDQARLAQLGLIASMQPIHATSDMHMADRYWGERSALAYAWRTQLDQGATLAFGSDAPVESPNPFWGLHAAVTRRTAQGEPGPVGWYPEQRLDVAAALRGFTGGAAYAAGLEDRLGKLAAGYLADLLVLEDDPFTCDPARLRDLLPAATMVGGEWVYRQL